jgi:mannose-6-phosphate isomerase-like protein (cupin superfamily)
MSRTPDLSAGFQANESALGRSLQPRRFQVSVDDPGRFSTARVQAIRHSFQDHPLFQLPELAKLAKVLYSTKQCRFIMPGARQNAPFEHDAVDPGGRGIDEVFAHIEESGSWVALYNVETHPPYRALLEEIAANVRPLVEPQEPGMFNVGGFIFVSAPPSVTPFHIDRENNFWLQIRGRKTMNVWEATDTHVVPTVDRETFIVNASLDNVRLKDGFRERSHEFDVGPGDGVYFPSTSPHMTRSETDWTKPGDGVSISIGVVFYTDVTRRTAHLHILNRFLRKLGLVPRAPGERPWVDALKYPLAWALVSFKKLFRGYVRAGI